MRLLNQVIFMFLLMLSVKAQVYQWAKGIGGAESDVGQAIAVDAEGNVYTTGYFSGTVDFDPGPGVVQWSSSGDRDIFILKTDKFGNLLWVNTFGGTSLDVPYSIALDNSGYFCVSGLFSETVDFDPGPNKWNWLPKNIGMFLLLNLNSLVNLFGLSVWVARMVRVEMH